jgi:hypothetical protein
MAGGTPALRVGQRRGAEGHGVHGFVEEFAAIFLLEWNKMGVVARAGKRLLNDQRGVFCKHFFLDAGRAKMINALAVDVMEPPKPLKDLQMTGKLETALGRRRLKHWLPVLEKHGVTDWTVGEVTDGALRGFGIDDDGIRRRIW